MRKSEAHPRTLGNTPTVRLDRVKFKEYCKRIGHSEKSLSVAYQAESFLSTRFRNHGGTVPVRFIDWCNKVYPGARDKLTESIIPEKKPEPNVEQMTIGDLQAPSMVRDKMITIQPVSIAGFNQLIAALDRISERLLKLEEAWNGHRE